MKSSFILISVFTLVVSAIPISPPPPTTTVPVPVLYPLHTKHHHPKRNFVPASYKNGLELLNQTQQASILSAALQPTPLAFVAVPSPSSPSSASSRSITARCKVPRTRRVRSTVTSTTTAIVYSTSTETDYLAAPTVMSTSVAAASVVPTSAPASAPAATGIYGLPSAGITKNGLKIGFLPDDGSGGSTSQSMAQINQALGMKSATYGRYAQTHAGILFDGSQLLEVLDDVVASGAVFQPAVMPVHSWQGFTWDDTSQAVAVALVMQQFIDAGVEVWLRFAHEANYYQTDGTYAGDSQDFQTGWSVMYYTLKQYSPKTKMFFTPNVDSAEQYDAFFPYDPITVDIVGIDYYPTDLNSLDFVKVMKPFHDLYTNDRIKFAIGETGLGIDAPIQDRLNWLEIISSPATMQALPNFISLSWFNFIKGSINFKVAATDGSSITNTYLSSSS